jgi:MerR family transcriptional regulator, repressor of the yfmOP operon
METQKHVIGNWLGSEEVCRILRISNRTLVNYRVRGILPFSQISRKIYYKADDIQKHLDNHYIKAKVQGGTIQ